MIKNEIKQLNIPSNKTILDELKKDVFTNLNCVNIGEIQSFDSTDQSASISLQIKSIQSIEPDGTRIVKERPVLLKCPCITLSGGNSHITFPISSGDTCLVLFNDREIDNWFLSGGEVTPNTIRKHDLSDAIAIVGIRNVQNAISDYLENGVRIQYDSSSKIEFTTNSIETTATDFKQNGNMKITEILTVEGETFLKKNTRITGTLSTTGPINGGLTDEFDADGFTWTITNGVINNKVPL